MSFFSSGTGAQAATTQTSPWSVQAPYIKDVMQNAQNLYRTSNMQYYPGETVAGLSEQERNAQTSALATVPTMNKIAGSGANTLDFMLNKSLDPSTNPYYAQYAKAATNPLYEQLTEDVMPNIRSDAFAGGIYGTNRQGIAEGLATGRTARAAGDITSKMYSDLYQTGMNNMNQALQLAPTVQNMQLAGANVQSAVGQQDRAYQQALIDEAMARYNYNQMAPWAKLGAYQQLVSGNYGGESTSQAKDSGGDDWQQWLGLGLQAAATAAMFI